jgi:hypothetical protein
LEAGDREVVDLLELREFEKIDGEDREVELRCLAEGDDVERDTDGLVRLDWGERETEGLLGDGELELRLERGDTDGVERLDGAALRDELDRDWLETEVERRGADAVDALCLDGVCTVELELDDLERLLF